MYVCMYVLMYVRTYIGLLVDLPTVRTEILLHACVSNHKMMIINGKDAEANKICLTKTLTDI